MDIAHNSTQGLRITKKTTTGYNEFAIKSQMSLVPKEFILAFGRMIERMAKKGTLPNPAVLDMPRASPVWSLVAQELLNTKAVSAENARVMVVYALAISCIKIHEYQREQYLETKTELLEVLRVLQEKAHAMFDGLFPDMYSDFGDFVSALENSTTQPMIDASIHAGAIQNQLERLSEHTAVQGLAVDKLKARAVVNYAKYIRLHKNSQFKLGFNWKSVMVLFERIWYGAPNLATFESAVEFVEHQFGDQNLRSKIIMRAQ